MNLIFVWIEEYKKLRNFQTNFGSEYIIDFSGNEINIRSNDQFIRDFFKLETSDIKIQMSAIVGENGTGKSTLLDFIVEYIKEGTFKKGYIVIFEELGTLYLDTNIEIKNEAKLDVVLLKGESLDPILENLVTMFFSNVFDVRCFNTLENEQWLYEYEDKLKGNMRVEDDPTVINLTTNELLASYENPAIVLNDDSTKQIFFSNQYLDELEISRILELPSKIIVKNLEKPIELYEFSYELERFLYEFDSENVASMHFNFTAENDFKKVLSENVVKYYCVNVARLLKKYNLKDSIIKNAFNNASFDTDVIKILHKGIRLKIKKLESKKSNKLLDKLNIISKKCSLLMEKIKGLQINKDDTGSYFLLNNSETSDFIKFYRENFYSEGLISLHWSDMSSGQLGLLNLFGRFYNALHEVKEELEDNIEDNNFNFSEGRFGEIIEVEEVEERLKKYNYLLLIDECDLYFHPQWQKDWLFYFLKLIEILFQGNVQVILTTHSPFILSDFPNSNVTFLSSKGTLKNELEGSIRTFGANINELFTNSFFMNDGLMGKFAKNKINNFIKDFLNCKPDEVEANKDRYKKFIDIIGEPLIKNKLLQIYNEKIVLASNNSIEDRIKYLESELNKIKNRSDRID